MIWLYWAVLGLISGSHLTASSSAQAIKDARPQPQEAPLRNGKPAAAPPPETKPGRGLDGDWRAAKEKGEPPRERPEDAPRRPQDAPRHTGALSMP